ncbi:hypothetical protein ACTHSO_11705, partial [Neisseria sp. P0009.S004]|uniref:hypothetical protein n=1 Tax=Neisseria sp. P0009.S004 TaxID=3436711 RepID=UPI003F7EA06B
MRERKWLFDVPLVLRVGLGAFPRNGDTKRFLARTCGRERQIEALFNRSATQEVLARYPAHLHINLEAATRR